jgi:hypothetical protein
MDVQNAQISISITTSLPTLDLSIHDPFAITITFALHATHPITFNARLAYLFDGKQFCDDGLIFTNTGTGQQIERAMIDVCYDDNAATIPTEDNQKSQEFVTLFPGKAHFIGATAMRPYSSNVWPKHVDDMKGMAQEEIDEKQKAMGKVWSWFGIEGLEDGQEYEVGIADGEAVRCWLQGSVEGILEVKKLGLTPTVRREGIRFVAEKTARFKVRRPDDVNSY